MLGQLFNDPFSFFVWTIALLTAITVHEASHAFVADRLGDPTARLRGRLTLNPLAHLDPLGTLFLLLARFGWGKPVPIDPYNLRNPQRDSAFISLAGPTSNLLLATILSLFLRLSATISLPQVTFLFMQTFLIPVVVLNVALGVFNLLPVSPLDGFKIVGGFLPKNLNVQWEELESYGLIFLILLLFPFAGGSILINFMNPVISAILSFLLSGPGGII